MRKLAVVMIVVLALLAAAVLVVGILACGICRRGGGGQPTVRLLSPPEGTQIAVGRQIYIQARAFARGNVARVDFSVNGANVGSQSPTGSQRLFATAQPWTAASAGTYTLSVTAYDAEGQASDPAQVTVAVLEPGSFAPPTGATAVPGTTPPTGAPPPSGGWPEPVIEFGADRTSLQAGECTTLRWDAEYVQEVYLDGTGVAGHGTRDVCPSQTQTYVLHVVLPSGESRDYTVTVEVTGSSEPTTGPDLAVLAVACAGGQSDEAIPFQAEVQNQGDQAAEAAQWRWSVNAAEAGPGQWNDGGTFNLDAGATTLLQGSIPAQAAGNWTVYVEVRVGGETVTGNNRGSADFTVTAAGVELPDLVFERVSVEVPDPAAPQTIRVRVQVRNAGTGPAGAFTVRWYPHGSDEVGASWDHQGLQPGGTTQIFERSYTYQGRGEMHWRAVVDPDGEIDESNDNNNTQTGTVTIAGASAGGADLAVQISCPGERTSEQNIPFQVQVRNVGDLPATGATWLWILAPTGQEPGANWVIGEGFDLAAGQTTSMNGSISAQQAGDWTIHVMVGLNGETNIGNNEDSCRVTVSAAAAPGQVTLASVSVNPTAFTGSCPKTVTFNGTIKTSGPATVRYQWVRGVAAGSIRTLTFDAAGTQNVTGDWTLNQSGTYEMYLHIIAPNDTRSNVAQYTLNCTGGAPAAPSNVRVVNRTKTSITIRWDDNSDNELGFIVEVCYPPAIGGCGEIGNTGANATSWECSVCNLCGSAYRFRVRAFNADGNSAWSSQVEGTTRECN